jgi:NitT/TauT family transport system substrate-binding protein
MQTRNYSVIVIATIIIGGFIGSSNKLVPEIFAQNATTNTNIDNEGLGTHVKILRLGYFPNINHAQAVIGVGRGDFQKALGPDVKLETVIFNAGPSAIEALLAKRIDATYVGSNPAINGYVVSDGKGLRIVAGAASAGAVFVVRNDSGVQSPKDIGGKKFASPQLGNTQDIALRKYIQDNGF